MKDLFLAFGLAWNMLTIIPFFKVHDFFKGINGLSAMFYPLVGLLTGFILYSINSVLASYVPSSHLHMIIFACWVVITGAIHLDGFSDTIDGLFVSKEKALEVMKDSHIGGMGMIFSIVFLLLKASSVIALEELSLLILVMVLSRSFIVFVIHWFRYVSKGVGALIKEELKIVHLVVVFLFGLLVSIYFHHIDLIFLGLFFSVATAFFFQKRYGGLNGDIYGFIIEFIELLLLQILIIQS